jgi:hypothetical protein
VKNTRKDRHEKVRAADDLSVFSYIAFQRRFKKELTSRWQKLEYAAYSSIISAPVVKKYKPFQKFFEDAECLVAETIREYFPRLLDFATARRPQDLGNVSPLDWTKSHTLKEVCDFLGIIDEKVDENFDWASEPRDDSRVLRSANRLTQIAGFEEEPSSEFLLPRWIHGSGRHPVWAIGSPESRSARDARFAAERMSRAETTQWVKYTEFLITRKVALQIDENALDSCIDAGAPGKSVNLILEGRTEKQAFNQYRSALKRHIKNCLTNDPEATVLQVCRYLDEQDAAGIPPRWLKNGNRELTVAYRDRKVRPLIDSMISKVRGDLRA